MKYSKEERLNIGRRIYQGELNLAGAAVEYDINIYTARDYLRLYKAKENIYIIKGFRSGGHQESKPNTESYEQMSREELIKELARIKIEKKEY